MPGTLFVKVFEEKRCCEKILENFSKDPFQKNEQLVSTNLGFMKKRSWPLLRVYDKMPKRFFGSGLLFFGTFLSNSPHRSCVDEHAKVVVVAVFDTLCSNEESRTFSTFP